MSTNMVGNTGVVVVLALGTWLLVSVLVGIAVGACLRPRTRITGEPVRLESGMRQPARAA
jgi:Na+/H+-dicarboxylate symporter